MRREKKSHRAKPSRGPKSQKAKRIPRQSIVINCLLILVFCFVAALTIVKITEYFIGNQKSTLPELSITLKEVPIEVIDSGDKSIVYPGNTATLTSNNTVTTFENVEIKGRGNLSWIQPKRPYQIKLSEKSSLLNIAAAKKWILIADYLDNSRLRNETAFYLQHVFGSKNAIDGGFVELNIDDNYRGLYYLAEKVEITKNRINLRNPDGIIVELDNLHTTEGSCPIRSENGDCFIVHDSINKDNDLKNLSNFVDKFNQLEAAVNADDYSAITELADIDSFAKYFLLNEFVNNPDGYGSSFFLYTDGTEDKIHAGAGWDFDLSFGNRLWVVEEIEDEVYRSPFNTMILKDYLPIIRSVSSSNSHLDRISPLLYTLMDIPEFAAKVREIYQSTLSGHGEELLNHIESQADYIREAVHRDQARWKLKFDFDEEVDYLVDWVAKRYDHFEEVYGAKPTTETGAAASAYETLDF